MVHVSAAYRVLLQTTDFKKRFLKGRLVLLVRNISFSAKLAFAFANLILISDSQRPLSEITLPRYLNSFTASTSFPSINILIGLNSSGE